MARARLAYFSTQRVQCVLLFLVLAEFYSARFRILHSYMLASFPGHSRLQILIGLSMQKTEGEDLGERVTCMMSGRHEGRQRLQKS